MKITTMRSGTTLIELLIFTAIFGILGTAVLPLLFLSSEKRLLQQTQALVESNGTQIFKQIGASVLEAETILDPPIHASGAVLTLQTGSGAESPVIFAVSSGSLLLIRHATQEILSSQQIHVEEFSVRNTSSTAQGVVVSFTLSRVTQIQPAHTYSRFFQASFTLPPVDHPSGDSCGCALPSCVAGTSYTWQVCESGCLTVSTALECET
jgi:hypothetical protein